MAKFYSYTKWGRIGGVTMILTGKDKEAFEKWVFCMHHEIRFRSLIKIHNQRDLFISYDDIPGTFLNTLIIEWLDSVGIYVSINYVDVFNDHDNKQGFESYVTYKRLSTKYRAVGTSQQATEKAIEKAIEIYNERGN